MAFPSIELSEQYAGTELGQASSADELNTKGSLVHTDTDDALDPRSWSSTKKRLVFVALMSSSLLADGGMTWGATLVGPQAVQWRLSIARSATSLNYGILLQGFGGVFAVPLIETYGRLPVWFWSQLITLGVVIGCTAAPSFASFTAFRSLQGLFGTVPQVIGLPIIYDMYHPKDWPPMINTWGTTFLVGPFLGPAIAGYLLKAAGWRGSFAVLVGLYALSTTLVLAFGRETYYARGRGTQKNSYLQSLVGIGNTNVKKRSTLIEKSRLLFVLTLKAPLLLVGISTLVDFTWPIGISTTIDGFIRAPPYLFDNTEAASMRFAGVIGALCGYAFGYFFNEWIYKFRCHRWRPEYRLHGVWAPIASLAGGLLCYGLTLNFEKSWVGLAVGWVMINTGMVASTVAITAFAVEKYPDHATTVSAILNMWRTCGGFAVGYFQPAWIAANGVGVVFGIQATIVATCIVVTILPVILMSAAKA